MKKRFQKWIEDNKLNIINFSDEIVIIDNIYYLLVTSEDKEVIFNEEFELQLNELEESIILEESICSRVIFEFGQKFYYSGLKNLVKFPRVIFTVELKELKYIGESVNSYDDNFAYLGIHGEYELCHGSRLYSDWCKKAKFLNIDSLGICERHTLAGVVNFQEECKSFKIKSIIGEEITVKYLDYFFTVKLFVKNQEGWINLLHISNSINTSELNYVDFDYFLTRLENLFIVLQNDTDIEKLPIHLLDKDLYYQFDFSQWDNETKDIQVLNRYKNYKNYFNIHKTFTSKGTFTLKPVLLQDSYFLDKSDYPIQRLLNKIGDVGWKSLSKEHYLKDREEVINSFGNLFSSDEDFFFFYEESVNNAKFISENCNFEIKLKNQYLPKFQYDTNKFSSEEELFLSLISEGLNKIGEENLKEFHFERIDEELEVIKLGGFISYFLILHDIVDYCKKNDIWYGIGRGSAGGCFIAYLLDIIQINPFDYDLLFERFLNKGRVKGGLPDIDFDIQSSRRDEVKRYIESKYGVDRVCSIGTFQTFKIKLAFKDLSRFLTSEESVTLNYLSAMIQEVSDDRYSQGNSTSLLYQILKNKSLKEFIEKYPLVWEYIPLIFKQCKNQSIHPAGIIITPKKDSETLSDWLPVKKVNGVIVSEWEGTILDDIGFLKNDILGILQLDKFKSIFELIKETTGREVRFLDIDLKDKSVFEYFQKGMNEDVFQFGASGLRAYCKELQPEVITDLIATVALYRPGPIYMGTHKKYVRLKNGREDVFYDWNCEEITKDTYGLVVYQEQIIRICQVVAGFTLVEADNVRKAMGKMLPELMEKYSKMFISQAIEKGCPKEQAEDIWSKMEKFAEYGFNKSHAASYALTAYLSQYYKVHFPLQFWSVSLKYSTQDDLESRVSEIQKDSNIKLLPVDINYSESDYKLVFEQNSIYWSLSSISYVSTSVLEHIINERKTNGMFFSLSEFISRVEKKIVNKRVITNLILSGAFDNICNVKNVKERLNLLLEYHRLLTTGGDTTSVLSDYGDLKEYQWILKQKEISNYGYIPYKKLFYESSVASTYEYYETIDIIELESFVNQTVCIAGIISEVIERNSKNGIFAQVSLQINSEIIYVTMWNEEYKKYKKEIQSSTNKIVWITGIVYFDSYKGFNTIHCNSHSKFDML